MENRFLSVCHISCLLHKIGDMFNTVSELSALTSHVLEVDGLSVGVEQLDDGVVVVLHPAADGGHFTLDHRDVVGRQVLTFSF